VFVQTSTLRKMATFDGDCLLFNFGISSPIETTISHGTQSGKLLILFALVLPLEVSSSPLLR
jgi:hypothetical protein